MAVKPVVLCLSRSGEDMAQRLARGLGAMLHGRAGRVGAADAHFDDTIAHIRALFASGTPIVGVCASGILIRALAPLLADKHTEPPVLALSEDGAVAVPLLGGHHGANALAADCARLTGGRAAITTAGDVALGVALDCPPPGYRLANPEGAKAAVAALLDVAGARVVGENIFDLPDDPAGTVELVISEAPVSGAPLRLIYHPQRFALGVGCARGADPAELWTLVRDTLARAGIAPGAVASLNTLDLKADEPAMNALAHRLGVPLRLFTARELEDEAARLANPSDVVFAEVGCHGVAEGAALAAVGMAGVLVAEKRKSAATTCAIARAPQVLSCHKGRARGCLAVLGIGPGQASWRTPEVSALVAKADLLVGYGLYIDLLGPLAAGKPRHDFPLGGEEARCRFALEEAASGKNVALICSGDAGIYAMGALVYERLAFWWRKNANPPPPPARLRGRRRF